MAVSPLTPTQTQEWAGHPITVFLEFTSTGATKAETVTMHADYPQLDLTKSHPIIALKYISIEGSNTIHQSETAMNITDEVARATAADSDGEFDIESATSFKIYTTNDNNGIILVSYWAAGIKST